MTKIFSVDFRKGSYIDTVNKIVGVPTSLSKFIRTDKGTALSRVVNHAGINYEVGSKSLSKFTIVAWLKQRTTDTGERYTAAMFGTQQIIRRDLSSTLYNNYININVRGAIAVPNDVGLNKWVQFVVTYDGANVVTSVNNFQITGNPYEMTGTVDFDTIRLGANTTSRYSDSDILKFEVYDDVISDKEIELDYKALLESQITEKPVRGFELVKPTDLSHERNTHFTGDEYTQVMEFTDNASDSSTLLLNDGGDFAVVDWTGNSDFQEISTSSETESPVIPSTVKIFAKNGVLTYFKSTNNNFSFDIANLPSGLTYYYNAGSNTTTGDIANLPSDLTYYYNAGSNTTTGDIANLPSDLTYYYNAGSNTVDTYTAGRTWANNMQRFVHLPAAGYGLSSTDVDNLLIDLANVTTWTSSKEIDLSGNNAAPGPLGKAAIDTLRNVKGVTVTVTGGY